MVLKSTVSLFLENFEGGYEVPQRPMRPNSWNTKASWICLDIVTQV